MAYTTNLQQVLAYLKAGHKLQPPSGVPLAEPAPATAAFPTPKAITPRLPTTAPPVRK